MDSVHSAETFDEFILLSLCLRIPQNLAPIPPVTSWWHQIVCDFILIWCWCDVCACNSSPLYAELNTERIYMCVVNINIWKLACLSDINLANLNYISSVLDMQISINDEHIRTFTCKCNICIYNGDHNSGRNYIRYSKAIISRFLYNKKTSKHTIF